MKAAFVICLLAFIACEKDIIDIGKCIYKAPKVKELINDAIAAIITKDFKELLSKIQKELPELIKIVTDCITKEKAVEEEEPELNGWLDNLTKNPYYRCLKFCNMLKMVKPHGYCHNKCKDKLKKNINETNY